MVIWSHAEHNKEGEEVVNKVCSSREDGKKTLRPVKQNYDFTLLEETTFLINSTKMSDFKL